ncbi:MAG: LacI family DNA-binding transcriptional regulator [Pseudomonadota bacterium]
MKKATSFDIAHMAGVSQSTVSRALSDSPLVNQETRDRIKKIAEELNYKVDKNASNLRKQRSQTLALLLFEDPTNDDSLINPFFISMLASITKTTTDAGYDLLVSFQNLNDDWHAVYKDSSKADGLILLGYGSYTEYEHKLEQLQEQDIRFIRWGAPDLKHPGITIGSDNFKGGYIVTQHLLELGRKHFAFIGTTDDSAPEMQARFQGCQAALEDCGIESENIEKEDAISIEKSGYDATVKLVNRANPDAIFCASDLIALGSIRALRERGIKVPEDIAVVGYDNIQISEFFTPPLTTVYQNTATAGELLVKNLLLMLNDEEVTDILMKPELIVRKSCGA